LNKILITIILSLVVSFQALGKGYKNFEVVLYCPVDIVAKMSEGNWLKESFKFIERNFTVDKVYLETHRHNYLIEEEKLEKVINFFKNKGIKVAGGITTTGHKKIANHFAVYCYSDNENKEHLKNVVEFTARHFNEIILDDFYFTSCKCSLCTNAKGETPWPQFRMDLMQDISKEIFIKPAKAVNPNVHVIIKFPNWYEYYQYTGYDLKEEPKIFDMIYAGTETRDPVYHQQNMQPYQSYLIMRYFENVKPDKNGGGWIDPLDKRVLERYAEQIRLTLLSKPKEVTLFHYGALFEKLNGDKFVGFIAPVAGNVFKKTDSFLGELGNPIGIASYRPFNASGESYLHSYFGMLGIPVELMPTFPEKSGTILLTEGAKADTLIIKKMKAALLQGKNIIITSGFLRAMQNKGLEDIIMANVNGKKFFTDKFTDLNFKKFYSTSKRILFPQVEFGTNDSWKEIAAISNGNSFPLLLTSSYGKGLITLIVIPDNFSDLYDLPTGILNLIKKHVARNLPVSIEAEGRVALFLYDNNTFVVHSFLPHKTELNIVINSNKSIELTDLLSGKKIKRESGDKIKTVLNPYSYKVYKWR
jgi:hypothetical protein